MAKIFHDPESDLNASFISLKVIDSHTLLCWSFSRSLIATCNVHTKIVLWIVPIQTTGIDIR